jgi:adenylate cyclase
VLKRQGVPTDSTTTATVLFADLSGASNLLEAADPTEAIEAIRQCLHRLRHAARLGGAHVVRTVGQEVMALFPAPAAAADAASAMQAVINALPEAAHNKLGVRIAFLSGPVIVRDGDVLGDTVDLTARLVEHAKKDQIITSSNTAAALGQAYQARMRDLLLDAKAAKAGLCELVWRGNPDRTRGLAVRAAPPTHEVLRLRYGATQIVRRPGRFNAIRIGRELDCGLIVFDDLASRRHCTIEHRGERFVLVDHSTNGTYLTEEGDPEILLRGEDLELRRHGWLALGQSRVRTSQVVEYFCD